MVRPHRPDRIVAALLEWFALEARDLPWRRTLDPYAVWVSEIMLQQTQVKTVIPYWERWMRDLPDLQALARAPQEKILKLWEGLGYYTRVRNLQKAAQQIVRDNSGTFPQAFDAVLALSGVGRYTAGAITSIAFNQPSPILDGNVIRVLTRLYGIEENPKDKATNARLWQLAEELVQTAITIRNSKFEIRNPQLLLAGSCSALNQSLMELGALICTPKQPRCAACPLRKQCVAFKTSRVESLPNLDKRAPATDRRFVAFLIRRDNEWLVQQRPAGVVNAHLWEFPNTEVGFETGDLAPHAAKCAGAGIATLERFTTVKHSITRYRISLEAYLVSTKTLPRALASSKWRTLADLDALALTSAHRKVLMTLGRFISEKQSTKAPPVRTQHRWKSIAAKRFSRAL